MLRQAQHEIKTLLNCHTVLVEMRQLKLTISKLFPSVNIPSTSLPRLTNRFKF